MFSLLSGALLPINASIAPPFFDEFQTVFALQAALDPS
jgi:hypothetical protein